mmetsp:Transcript_785/g.1743  ORF Transcript_785/g.1743 Transcript_785/m.1743 type:complete len:147 (+) Transcript_785:177-617(+)
MQGGFHFTIPTSCGTAAMWNFRRKCPACQADVANIAELFQRCHATHFAGLQGEPAQSRVHFRGRTDHCQSPCAVKRRRRSDRPLFVQFVALGATDILTTAVETAQSCSAHLDTCRSSMPRVVQTSPWLSATSEEGQSPFCCQSRLR